ncbi:MurR/RpiR family transcriptional regulator [Streptomyces sp. NPDC001508]|uniref:MurR/RpiR family transcriptional regulator n=1 Tax=Streptomyces sp. NPDC001508 TaxID=3154656 RepID=UPI003316C2E6
MLQELTDGEFIARVQASRTLIGPTDRRIIDAIVQDPKAVVEGTVSDLAKRAGAAQSSVIRACHSLGYGGFQEMKLTVTRDLARREVTANENPELTFNGDLTSDTPPTEIIRAIAVKSAETVRTIPDTVSPEAFSAALDALQQATRIVVVGNGTSAGSARDASYRLAMLGRTVSAPSDSRTQQLHSHHLSQGTVCLVISHAGSTRETLNAATAAKDSGATVVALTSFRASPLTDIASIVLVAGGFDYGFRLEVMASRLAHLAVIDALFVGLALREPEQSALALEAVADIGARAKL